MVDALYRVGLDSGFLVAGEIDVRQDQQRLRPLATLKLQLKLIDWTPRSLHPVWLSASVRVTDLSYTWSARCDGSSATVSGIGDLIFTLSPARRGLESQAVDLGAVVIWYFSSRMRRQ